MISVNSLWEQVRDLTRKDHAGYTSTDEFNRLLNLAQQQLTQYYLDQAESDADIERNLNHLVKRVELSPSATQLYDHPADFRKRKSIRVKLVENAGSGGPVVSEKPCTYMRDSEVGLTLSSPIRKPSLSKRLFRFEDLTGQFKIWPADFSGNIILKYYSNPPTATRGFTLNTGTQEEEYDVGTTTDLVWPETELTNFVDLLLLYKGIALRESELVQWVQAKKSQGVLPEEVRDITDRKI